MPNPEHKISIAILLLSAAVFSLLLWRHLETPHSPSPLRSPSIFEVKGDIPRPGIYTLDSAEAAVSKALLKAGWSGEIPVDFKSRKVISGESLELLRNNAGVEIRVGRMSAAALIACGQKLDLNAASLEDLLLVPQIRQHVAERIVKRREAKPWESVDELQEIQGVGPGISRRLSDYLAVFPPEPR